MRPARLAALAARLTSVVPGGVALAVAAAAMAAAGPTAAQPVSFGSADDVLELGSGFQPRDQARAAAYLGPAYLPDTWRGAARVEAEVLRGRFSAALGATVHPGAGGLYGPEADEPYDLARAVGYVRWNATAGRRTYARLGPTDRVSLGSGALVRQYRTTTAWDERTLGLEAAAEGRRVRAAAFAGDVLSLDGVVGGEVTVRTGAGLGPVSGLSLTLAAVHDLGLPGLAGDSSLTGVEATVRGDYRGVGPLSARPFVTHARYLGRGSTLGGGVELASENLADALRARATVAVFASTGRFVPGHVGPFYAVSNGAERIVDDASFFGPGEPELAGTPLDSVAAGVDVVLDVRLLAFGRVEVSQYARRHIGDDRASGYGLRLAGRLPGQGRVEFALERQDFRGFFDLIQDLGQLNALILDVQVPAGPGVLFVRSRYGYRRLTEADGPAYADGPGRFLVERRFEPLVGLRVEL